MFITFRPMDLTALSARTNPAVVKWLKAVATNNQPGQPLNADARTLKWFLSDGLIELPDPSELQRPPSDEDAEALTLSFKELKEATAAEVAALPDPETESEPDSGGSPTEPDSGGSPVSDPYAS